MAATRRMPRSRGPSCVAIAEAPEPIRFQHETTSAGRTSQRFRVNHSRGQLFNQSHRSADARTEARVAGPCGAGSFIWEKIAGCRTTPRRISIEDSESTDWRSCSQPAVADPAPDLLADFPRGRADPKFHPVLGGSGGCIEPADTNLARHPRDPGGYRRPRYWVAMTPGLAAALAAGTPGWSEAPADRMRFVEPFARNQCSHRRSRHRHPYQWSALRLFGPHPDRRM